MNRRWFMGLLGLAPFALQPSAALRAAPRRQPLRDLMARVPSLDVDSDYVTWSGARLVHGGETIVPRAETSIVFAPEITAINTDGVRVFLREHGHVIARRLHTLH